MWNCVISVLLVLPMNNRIAAKAASACSGSRTECATVESLSNSMLQRKSGVAKRILEQEDGNSERKLITFSSPGEACNISMEMPNPYTPSYLADVYDVDIHPYWYTKFEGMEDRLQTIQKFVNAFTSSCAGKRSLRKLIDDGLRLNQFGMDFTEVYTKRYGLQRMKSGIKMAEDEEVMSILKVYYPTQVSRFIETVDFPQRLSSYPLNPAATAFGLSSSETELLRSFQRDGFVIIDEWPDLDMVQHAKEAADRLSMFSIEPSSSHMHVHTGFVNFKKPRHVSLLQMSTLDPMFKQDSFLMRLSGAYLGAPAETHTMSAFTLKGSATKHNYSNGPWHFDGCGTRLKAWIYHNDVDDHTHPTVIAAGTQNFHWFPPTEYFVGKVGQNKLNPKLIEKEFGNRLHKMLGKKGGGFIFDTNAIHGAVMSGQHKTRKTTLIELSTAEHMAMPRHRGPDDGYLSGWVDGLCPAAGDR